MSARRLPPPPSAPLPFSLPTLTGARLANPRPGFLQIKIARYGTIDQTGEFRIAERCPPRRQGFGICLSGA